MGILPRVSPQGCILLIKGLAGLLTGALVYYVYVLRGLLTGGQAFTLVLVAYAVVSVATAGLAKKANPPVSTGLYAAYKGVLTFFSALYVCMVGLHNLLPHG